MMDLNITTSQSAENDRVINAMQAATVTIGNGTKCVDIETSVTGMSTTDAVNEKSETNSVNHRKGKDHINPDQSGLDWCRVV
jgi:hypothetical protein